MPVWRLVPVDPLDPNWESSSHRGPVVVRAPDEGAARETAEKAFAVRSRFPPGRGMKVPPWTRPELVRVMVIEHSIHPAEGPAEVLEPSFEQDLPSHPPVKEPRKGRRRAGRPAR